jgi:hypothetical protein
MSVCANGLVDYRGKHPPNYENLTKASCKTGFRKKRKGQLQNKVRPPSPRCAPYAQSAILSKIGPLICRFCEFGFANPVWTNRKTQKNKQTGDACARACLFVSVPCT